MTFYVNYRRNLKTTHVTILGLLSHLFLLILSNFAFLSLNVIAYHKADIGVIVIGGGHSGCEAASAAARTGTSTLLITQDFSKIGELSCNPSIGGIGKGHLVKEVDALGGLIGKTADSAAIHFRLLNRKKGPAVRGLRVQVDRDIYKSNIQKAIFSHSNLEVMQSTVESLIIDNSSSSNYVIRGVKTVDGTSIYANSVVMTSGTFLRARCWIGKQCIKGGRFHRSRNETEASVEYLGSQLSSLGFKVRRFKTGTPPRLDRSGIDWSQLVKQPSEAPLYFSHHSPAYYNYNPLIDCYQAFTNAKTHSIVMDNLQSLPIFESGGGKGLGPRYCPSIATKVERFSEKPRHTIWLEPESINSSIVFPNGLSGGFPVEIQEKIIHSIPGLQNCKILRPAYDVEYDFIDPQCLTHALNARAFPNLFLCGQICGTTGYEEAAAMGVIAGANAALLSTYAFPFIIERNEGYIGVLIDDLVSKGTSEPYRMFTSRAEFRLNLRNDNADLRLSEKAYQYGLISNELYSSTIEKEKSISHLLEKLGNFSLTLSQWNYFLKENFDTIPLPSTPNKTQMKSALEILSLPNVTYSVVQRVINNLNQDSRNYMADHHDAFAEHIESVCKYKNYICRHNRELMKKNSTNFNF